MENDDIQKSKIEKFKSMGIPIPMEKKAFEQPVTNVKDPKMLQRIQEIKSGAKKKEFNEILHSKENNQNFKPIPEPKQRVSKSNKEHIEISNNPNFEAPKLESFAPAVSSNDLMFAESLFDDTPTKSTKTPPKQSPGSRINEVNNTDNQGSDFLNEFRAKMQAKAMTGGFNKNNQTNGFGFNEQENNNNAGLQSMIESVASEVAKKVAAETIKNVLDEYLSKKTNLNENTTNTYKKIKDDIVLIEGKYYKLVPVVVKPKK